MPGESFFSFSITDSGSYTVGLVGRGPALEVLAQLVEHKEFAEAFPKLSFVGWAPGEYVTDAGTPLSLASVPHYAEVAELFAAHPDMRAVLDLSPDGRFSDQIRALAMPGAAIGSAEAVIRFCAAAHDGRLAVGGGRNLRKIQQLFGYLVDQIEGDMLILDADGKILDVNNHAARSRGLDRTDMLNRNCREFDQDSRFCFDDERCVFAYARGKGKVVEHTIDQTLENGRVRYISATCVPVTDLFGGPTQYLYIRRDVTEQQRMYKLLEQQEKDAALGKLTLYLAHEIRNPLFAIGGFANALLRNTSLNDMAREKARIIYEESRRLDTILTKILNFAKATEQSIVEFDPEIVLQQTLSLMGKELTDREKTGHPVQVHLTIEPGLPMVRGNEENVKECLHNMVKNSLEAMAEGGRIDLIAKRDNGYVRIEVTDTGRGIPPELQEQVFNPFFSTKEGMGLGLGMSRKVIEDMGGKMLLDSTPGEGTTISIFMPVALAVEESGNGPVLGSLENDE